MRIYAEPAAMPRPYSATPGEQTKYWFKTGSTWRFYDGREWRNESGPSPAQLLKPFFDSLSKFINGGGGGKETVSLWINIPARMAFVANRLHPAWGVGDHIEIARAPAGVSFAVTQILTGDDGYEVRYLRSDKLQPLTAVGGWPNSRMYGWPIEDEKPEPKKPEPNPTDKAIDDMMARRKAKREPVSEVGYASGAKTWDEHRALEKQSEALGNAMSKTPRLLYTHFGECLAYRGPVL